VTTASTAEARPARTMKCMTQSPVVELTELVKSFETPTGVVHAVRDVNLSIRAGEMVALLGPNGAGKSTTIDILLGLTDPDAGTVRLLGAPPRAATEAGLVGVMLQTGALIRDLSVRELVTMTASLFPAPLDVDDVLQLVGIEAIAERRTQKLSGGETQRVRFALALTPDPDLLVLDEPTVSMDVEARHAFWQAMRRFAEGGRTVLFATHQLEEADAHADRAVLLAEGRVVAAAPTNELKAMVGRRMIRATLPDVPNMALMLPGVESVERHGGVVVLRCTHADRALRALLDEFPETRNIELASAGLEQAFLALTSANGAAKATEEALR
jgi:ABC-2 type transport system ATP-binding protein